MALSREEIANRYGSALFGYAQDMRALETVYDDLQELKKLFKLIQEFLQF